MRVARKVGAVAVIAAIVVIASHLWAETKCSSQRQGAIIKTSHSENPQPAAAEQVQPATQAEPAIPDTLVIGALCDKYSPVSFSHKYHADMVGSCVTCHHNAPAGETPSCGECHDAKSSLKKKDMPSLKAAYHLQCIDCHKNQGAGPTGCTDCHSKKQTSSETVEKGSGK